jgi:hypothetical protein
MQQLRLSDILPFLQELSMAEKNPRLLLAAAVVEEVMVAAVVVGEAAERSTRMPWCNRFCFVIFEQLCSLWLWGMSEYRFVVQQEIVLLPSNKSVIQIPSSISTLLNFRSVPAGTKSRD